MSDKPVAIVVAAGGGIGGACTRELAQRGYNLVLMSAGGSAVKLADELGGAAVTGSVAEAAELKTVVDTALEKHGRIDAVINNTGHVTKGAGAARGPIYDPEDASHFIDISDADWHHALDMSVLNVIRMARLVTPVMERQGGGAIVNISSFAAKEPSGQVSGRVGAENGAGRRLEAVFRPLRAGRHPYEQRAARLRRQPRDVGRGAPRGAHGPHVLLGRIGQDRRLPVVVRRRLHHRPKHRRRRRPDARRLRPDFPDGSLIS